MDLHKKSNRKGNEVEVILENVNLQYGLSNVWWCTPVSYMQDKP